MKSSGSYKKESEERDKFEISNGNLVVLTSIPEMMKIPKYRNKLRRIVIDFIQEKTLKFHAERGFL